MDPYEGARIAVAEAARNLSCVGATPLAVTDCLNFASPEKPEGFWQFRRAVEGLADACEALGTPVISGNVSFYNETPERAIYPTPTVGMVGLLPDADKRVTLGFKNEGDAVYLLRPDGWAAVGGLGGSEYLSIIHGREVGKPPYINFSGEARVQNSVRKAISSGLLQSAHDCSEGGLVVALAECCLAGGKGVTVRSDSVQCGELAVSDILFGEACSRIVVTVHSGPDEEALLALAEDSDIEAILLGTVGPEERLKIGDKIDTAVSEMRDAYESAIPAAMAA